MLNEFKKFALRGNVIDLAVGIIIGAAFNNIVQSLVNDIIMPPLGLLTGNLNFDKLMLLLKAGEKASPPYTTPAQAAEAGAVTINYGMFINNIISFLLVAFAVFLLVRAINRLYRKEEQKEEQKKPDTRNCPFCIQEIPLAATRCPHCTSEVTPATPAMG